MKPQYLIIGLVIVLAAAAMLYDLYSGPQMVPVTREAEHVVYDPVPDFSVKDLEESIHRISDFKGKIVLLNFWATWCTPCVKEFPAMLDLLEVMNGEVVLLAVSVDEDREAIIRFLERMGAADVQGLIVAQDQERAISHGLFMTERYPETIVISSDGFMVRKIVGETDWSSLDMRTYLESL